MLERRLDDLVHPAFIDGVPVAGAIDERVALERLRQGNAEKMLHLGDTGVFVRHSRRNVAHHLETVLGTGLLERADHRFGQAFIEFQEGRTGRLDPNRRGVGGTGARVLQQDGVLEAGLAGADEGTAGEQPRHGMNAGTLQLSHGRNGGAVEITGLAKGRHAVLEIEQRRRGRQLQAIVRRQMDMHVDQARQGETSREFVRRWPMRVHDSGNRSTGDLDGRVGASALHRIDNGNAIDLKPAFCRDWWRCRPSQAEVVEYTHREAIPGQAALI